MFYHYLRGYSYFAIMTVSIVQWHAGVRLFYGKVYVSVNVFNINICLSLVCQNLFSLVYCFYLFFFRLYCVTEMLNPIQDQRKVKSFLSCCHWNVNSPLAHNCAKLTSLEAYNSVLIYDFICISKMSLDSTISSDNNNLNISGYNLTRADHPSNSKRGSACIYYCSSNFE